MEALSKEEENKIHNRQVAKEHSWIHALFEEAGLDMKGKKEIFKRLLQEPQQDLSHNKLKEKKK